MGDNAFWQDRPTLVTGATGGIIGEPACQDDCAAPELAASDWTFVHRSSQEVQTGCGDHYNVGSPLAFAGQCQDYSVQNPDWPFPIAARHCNDGQVLFGAEAPYFTDATVCELPWGGDHVLLGVSTMGTATDPSAQVFLLESH